MTAINFVDFEILIKKEDYLKPTIGHLDLNGGSRIFSDNILINKIVYSFLLNSWPSYFLEYQASCMRNSYDFMKADFSTEYGYLNSPLSMECYFYALEKTYQLYNEKSQNQSKHSQTDTQCTMQVMLLPFYLKLEIFCFGFKNFSKTNEVLLGWYYQLFPKNDAASLKLMVVSMD